MKSATIAAAVLASVAIAQPHQHRRHHHDKRDLVVEWETVWETATVIVDEFTTETIQPSHAATSTDGGQFFQAATTTAAAPVAATSTVQIAAAPQPTTLVPVVVPTTTAVAAVVEPTTSVAPVVAAAPTTTAEPAPVEPTTTAEPAPVEPTTTTEVAPVEPTTTAVAVPVAATTATTAAAAAATTASSSSSSSSGEDVKTGKMTYYSPGLGSCGYDDSGTDLTKNIVAVDIGFFQSVSSLTSYGIDEPANPLCNKVITISYGGSTTTATIRDSCPGCGSMGIDVTQVTFTDLLGSTDAGHAEVSWWLNDGSY